VQPGNANSSGGGNHGAIVVAAEGNARVGQAAKAPKEVVHTNTRFTADFKKRAGFLPSPLERLASDMSAFSTDTSLSSEAERAAANDCEWAWRGVGWLWFVFVFVFGALGGGRWGACLYYAMPRYATRSSFVVRCNRPPPHPSQVKC
jgi:hypothetical protein